MGLFSFLKDAGESLFRRDEAAEPTMSDAERTTELKKIEGEAAAAILAHLKSQGLKVDGVEVGYENATSTVTVSGAVPDQTTREKIVLICGNIHGIAKVDDRLTVEQSAPAAQFYTIEKGDTLSKIAQRFYGDAQQYQKIFEANQPMLESPDRIYPGQVVRIPDSQPA